MPNKQAIFDNIELYSSEELVKYIKDGIVTFDELCSETDGCFSINVRREVSKLLEGSEEEDWLKAKSSDSIELLYKYLGSYEDGIHREEARKLIKDLELRQKEADALSAWDSINKDDISELQKFIKENPADSHTREAKRIINEIQRENFLGFDIESLITKINAIQTDNNVTDPDTEIFKTISGYIDRGKITSNDLLNAIHEDNNLLSSETLRKLIKDGYLIYDDFIGIGISRKFIQHLANNVRSQRFDNSKKIDKINKLSTEVYFWGIPSSGKSCVIGAVLSVANNGTVAVSMSKDPDCQGYGYMTRLSHLFKLNGEVGTLPEGTSIYSTYEMGFDLEDSDSSTHPITCIDLAGELVRCMYKSDANEKLSQDELEALDTLTRILIDNRTKNRKIHFFVLEYGGENRIYEGLTQTVYLAAALKYIERTGIFKYDTDAIYLLITKVDKANAKGAELQEKLKSYISTNYQGFYNGLKKISRDCEINEGNVEIIPFSLGRVCFQDYCMFSDAPAANVVKKILKRTKGFKNGKIQKSFNWFKK